MEGSRAGGNGICRVLEMVCAAVREGGAQLDRNGWVIATCCAALSQKDRKTEKPPFSS